MTKEERKKNRFFSKFYDNHIDSLYRFVYFKVSSKAVARDIVSEAFTRLWEQLDESVEVDDPRAYLYQVARNLVVDSYRQRKGTVQPQFSLEDDSPTPEEEALEESDKEEVREALSSIKGSYQDYLIFYYIEKMSVGEISERKNKSENAVRVSIHRALEALKRKMGQ